MITSLGVQVVAMVKAYLLEHTYRYEQPYISTLGYTVNILNLQSQLNDLHVKILLAYKNKVLHSWTLYIVQKHERDYHMSQM